LKGRRLGQVPTNETGHHHEVSGFFSLVTQSVSLAAPHGIARPAGWHKGFQATLPVGLQEQGQMTFRIPHQVLLPAKRLQASQRRQRISDAENLLLRRYHSSLHLTPPDHQRQCGLTIITPPSRIGFS
jgi:hypothetical protein